MTKRNHSYVTAYRS